MAFAVTHSPQAISDSVMGAFLGSEAFQNSGLPADRRPPQLHISRGCADCVTGLEGQACRLLGHPGAATGGATGRGRTASNTCSSSGKSRPFRDAQYRRGCCSPGGLPSASKSWGSPSLEGEQDDPAPPHAPTIRDKSVLAAVETTGEGGRLFPLPFLPLGWGCPHP